MMATNPGPYHLDETRAIFKPDLLAEMKNVSETFYQELDEEFDDFKGHTLVSQFSFDEPWPTWEVHPKGDELVYLLTGETDLILRVDGADKVVRVDKPGFFVVVPKGVWHTARPLAPTTMLFITAGEGTLNAETPED